MEARRAIIAPQQPQYDRIVDLDSDRQIPESGPINQFRSERQTRDFGSQYVTARTRYRPAFLGKDTSLHVQYGGAGGTFPAACPINTDYDLVVHSFAADIEIAIVFAPGIEVWRNTQKVELSR